MAVKTSGEKDYKFNVTLKDNKGKTYVRTMAGSGATYDDAVAALKNNVKGNLTLVDFTPESARLHAPTQYSPSGQVKGTVRTRFANEDEARNYTGTGVQTFASQGAAQAAGIRTPDDVFKYETPPKITQPGYQQSQAPTQVPMMSATAPLPNPGMPSISASALQARDQGLDREQIALRANTPAGTPTKVPIGGMMGATGGVVGTSAPLPSPTGAIQSPPKASTGLMDSILKYMKPSTDETQTQQQIDNLTTSAKMGVDQINSEPIPYQVKYGTARNIEDQANTKIETLSQKLARMQAARQSALQVSQFSLERADREEAEAKRVAENLANEVKAERNSLKTYVTSLVSEGQVTSPAVNHAGTVYKSDGTKAYPTAEAFFKDFGISSFKEAYEKGILQDFKTPTKPISLSEGESLIDPSTGQVLYKNPKTYKATGGGGLGGGEPTATKVKSILNKYPPLDQTLKNQEYNYKLWEKAAREIDEEFGEGTATAFDAMLTATYQTQSPY